MFMYRDRLSASDMLQVRKVIEHIYDKVLGQGSEAGSQAGGATNNGYANNNSAANSSSGTHDKSDVDMEDMSSVAEEKVELLCNDQVHLVYS